MGRQFKSGGILVGNPEWYPELIPVNLIYDWLIPIGASTKREGGGSYAGYFGEGFKIASLCAIRDHGWNIEIRSRDWELMVGTTELNDADFH
jgi:hypothetical protein